MTRLNTVVLLLAAPCAALHAQGAMKAPPRGAGVAPFEVAEASVSDLQRAMAAARVTAAQLVDAYLARIAAYDHAGPSLNAGTRVIRRVLGPGMPSAGGWTRLLGLDLDAFHAGRLSMAVFTSKGAVPAAEVALKAGK